MPELDGAGEDFAEDFASDPATAGVFIFGAGGSPHVSVVVDGRPEVNVDVASRVRSSVVSPPLVASGSLAGSLSASPCAPPFIFRSARMVSPPGAEKATEEFAPPVASFGAESHVSVAAPSDDGKRTVAVIPSSRSDGKRTVAVIPFAATEAAASSAPGGTSNESDRFMSSADLSSATPFAVPSPPKVRSVRVGVAAGTASTTTSIESRPKTPSVRRRFFASAPATAAAAAID